MATPRSILLAGLLLAIACGGAASPPATPAAPASDGDGADAPVATTDDPATDPAACALEIALECPAGMIDGCLGSLTTHHVCVAEGEEAGPPCSQEIARECPADQVDACLRQPVVAATHVCVSRG